MSADAALAWLDSHTLSIPALDHYHKEAMYAISSKTSTLTDLANIIQLDPGMSLALYAQVNGKLERTGRDRISNIHSALSLLGQSAINHFVRKQKTLSAISPDSDIQQAYHQLVCCAHHAIFQVMEYIRIQGIKPGNEIRSAMLLHFIGEICVCLCDFKTYNTYKHQPEFIISGPTSAKPVFKFEFDELGQLIAQRSRLPEMVCESFTVNQQTGRNLRSIQLAGVICRQAEFGWNLPSMQTSLDIGASFLRLSTEDFRKKVEAASIHCARSFPLHDVFPAAARLILLPSSAKTSTLKKPESTKPETTKQTKQAKPPYKSLLQSFLKTPNLNQPRLLSYFIDYLYSDSGFSQVALLLLARDKNSMATRLSKGFTSDSAFPVLELDITQDRLLKSLLEKPQALLINKTNIEQYRSVIPDQLKSIGMPEEFILMSLFITDKPVGLIYADRTLSARKFDDKVYAMFKSDVLMTGKALSYLAQQTKQKAA